MEAKEDLAKGKLAPGGFFIESGQKSYIVLRLDAPSEWQSHAIYHEYTHFMTRNVVLPMWMIEGLAEFYGSTEIGLTSVKLGKPSPEVVFYLTNRRLLPLSTLLKVSRGMPEYNGEKMALTFYGESWALTHLLILKDFQQKTHHLHEYVENLREGQDSLAAATNAFGDLGLLQKELDAYITHAEFSMFEMATPRTLDPSTFKVNVATQIETDAIRAGVLAAVHRKPDARKLLDGILIQDPGNLTALETTAALDYQDGDLSASRKRYEQALEQHPSSCGDYYYAGYLAMRLGDTAADAAGIEANLLSAINLCPTFTPALHVLADFYRQREKLDEAHKYIVEAIQLEPENVRYRVDDATIFFQRKQPENALAVLKEAERYARGPKDTELITTLRDRINRSTAAN